MRLLTEYLSTKVKSSIIHATDDTIREIVKSEIDRLGFNADLNHIDVSKVTNFVGLFSGRNNNVINEPRRLGKKYKDINPDVSKWNVENAINFDSMFLGCEKFNCNLNKWDTSKAKRMSYMFCLCYEFNSDISNWDVSSCERMNGMFSCAKSFNCDISKWDVSHVWDMEYTFNEATSFTHDLSNWNTSIVRSHGECFKHCDKEKWPPNKRPRFNRR